MTVVWIVCQHQLLIPLMFLHQERLTKTGGKMGIRDLGSTACETPSPYSSASYKELDLSRVPRGLAASLRGEMPAGPETEPRCLAEVFNTCQLPEQCIPLVSVVIHLWPMEHADIEVPKT